LGLQTTISSTPPYKRKIQVTAILDPASDGTLAATGLLNERGQEYNTNAIKRMVGG
jgi:hypothetical protein